MTFTLKKSGQSDLVICHGAGYVGTAGKHVGPVGDFDAQAKWAASFRHHVGAAKAAPVNLKNAEEEVPLRTLVLCASRAAALALFYGWPSTLAPYTDGAKLEVVDDDGGKTEFEPAELAELSRRLHGVSVEITYKFLCKPGAYTAPPSS